MSQDLSSFQQVKIFLPSPPDPNIHVIILLIYWISLSTLVSVFQYPCTPLSQYSTASVPVTHCPYSTGLVLHCPCIPLSLYSSVPITAPCSPLSLYSSVLSTAPVHHCPSTLFSVYSTVPVFHCSCTPLSCTLFIPAPPPHSPLVDMRGKLIILSPDNKFFSTQCCGHTDLWLHSGSYIIINIIFKISAFQHPLRKSKLLYLFSLGYHSALLVWPLAAYNSFLTFIWASFGHRSLWSSLPAWLPWEPTDLGGLEPGNSSWDVAFLWCLFAMAQVV